MDLYLVVTISYLCSTRSSNTLGRLTRFPEYLSYVKMNDTGRIMSGSKEFTLNKSSIFKV